jgi:mycothiol system anti-sigma-R factor
MGDEHGHCIEILREVYIYLDGELTDDRRTLIRQHLDDCPPCLEAFEFEQDLRAVIAHRCREHVPDALRRRIADAIGLDPDTGRLRA